MTQTCCWSNETPSSPRKTTLSEHKQNMHVYRELLRLSPKLFKSRITIEQAIGEGEFGTIHRVLYENPSRGSGSANVVGHLTK
ncbi:hypothetical protein L596_005557 [Steinernema carpocapsae]|uniref:Protein kinase domain-containing protein n=1 Tax=Steinernema carpocapsae TaxID=34508 RepID=A0A4U8V0U1_STECR|nr:hypothetical protein L596_005557 [Steinernema carpocapsae]